MIPKRQSCFGASKREGFTVGQLPGQLIRLLAATERHAPVSTAKRPNDRGQRCAGRRANAADQKPIEAGMRVVEDAVVVGQVATRNPFPAPMMRQSRGTPPSRLNASSPSNLSRTPTAPQEVYATQTPGTATFWNRWGVATTEAG